MSRSLLKPHLHPSPFFLSPTLLVRGIKDNPPLLEDPPAEIPNDVKPCAGCGGPSPEFVTDRCTFLIIQGKSRS
ncbi:hypothetical protein SOVF_126010 [Spinacia oleracea]|nr:hypothetical protein SOVF_126010 [Spinacia oleracea]